MAHASEKRKIGLVLGSGGARGLAHIGVLKRLDELGFKPDCVVGTSIGALVGAVYSAGNLASLEALVETLDWRGLAQLFVEVKLLGAGLIKGDKVMTLLKQRDMIGVHLMKSLKVPFAAIATELYTEKSVALRDGNPVDAVRASIAVPGIFTPHRIGGRTFVDGGLTNPLPVEIAREMGAEVVIAVDVNLMRGKAAEAPEKPGVFDVLMRSIRLLENEVTRHILERSAPEVLIQPAVGHYQLMDFIEGRAGIQAGYEAADAAVPELRRLGLIPTKERTK